MSVSPLPTPLSQLTGRRFSFFPPIRNIEHNEWMYRRTTWSEIVVVNTKSGVEACIPRMFLGEVTRVDSPAVTVGLVCELEWREGAVCTHKRPVIELPIAVNDSRPVGTRPDRLAPVVNIRLESRPELRTGKKIGVAVMLGAVGCLIVADIARQIQTHQREDAFRLSRSYLQINATDDYNSIVHKLGPPASDRELSAPGRRFFRKLSYPRRQFSLVLMGTTRMDALYLGTLDPHGRILDATAFPDGTSAAPLLRSVPSF